MSDCKTRREYVKHLERVIKKYKSIMFLDSHTFTIKAKDDNESDGYFECKHNYPYLNGDIYYSQESYKDWKKGIDIELSMIHEMAHALTEPLWIKASARYVSKGELLDELEKLTDIIAAMVIKIGKQGDDNG